MEKKKTKISENLQKIKIKFNISLKENPKIYGKIICVKICLEIS